MELSKPHNHQGVWQVVEYILYVHHHMLTLVIWGLLNVSTPQFSHAMIVLYMLFIVNRPSVLHQFKSASRPLIALVIITNTI
jgi:hypothetical protein